MSNNINFTNVANLSQISPRMAVLLSDNITHIEKTGKFSANYEKDAFTTIHVSAKKRENMIEVTKQFTSKGGIPLPDQHYKCHIDTLRNH